MSLDERYGRRTGRDRRPLLFAVLGVFVLLAATWAVWTIWSLGRTTLTWTTVAVDASDPASVRVSFQVSQAAGHAALCSVRATDAAGAVVGWVDAPVRAATTRTTGAEVRVRTVRPATGGGVVSCVRR
jgi:hypothetical protein